MSRTQRLVVGFFIAAWAALLVILLVEPTIYDASLAPIGLEPTPTVRAGFVASVTVFLIVLGVGVVRRWRWIFWLVLIAFAAGILRVPASALQLAGVLPLDAPAWYATLQAAIGAVQVVIAIVMWRDYRQAGVWGRNGVS